MALLQAVLLAGLGLAILSIAYVMLRDAVQARDREQIDFRLHQYVSQYRTSGLEGIRLLCLMRRGRQQQAFFVRVADGANSTVFLRDAEDWAEFKPEKLAELSKPGPVRSWVVLHSPERVKLEIGSILLPDGWVLQVGKTMEDSRELLNRFHHVALVSLLLVIPIGIGVGAVMTIRAFTPVRQLGQAVESIVSTGEFNARVKSRRSGDEIDELVEYFNGLIGRIEGLVGAMRESLDNVAHDLRTPMTRLRSVAQTTLERDVSAEEAREALADCVEESERVLTMLNTIMDISEAEAGVAKTRREPFAGRAIVDEVVDLYRDVAEEKGIELTHSVPERLTAYGDQTMMRRVLANLLDNAIKYTDSGGAVSLGARDAGNEVSFWVQDNGTGITPEDLPRIWDRLYRGDKSRSARGLGLGLSFVRALVEAHGGSVTAASEVGAGSRFTVRLPVSDSDSRV